MRRVLPIYKCSCWQSIQTESKISKPFLTSEWRTSAGLIPSRAQLTRWQILSARWDIFPDFDLIPQTSLHCGQFVYLTSHFSTASLSVRWREEWKIWSTLLTSMLWPTSSIPSTSSTKPVRTWTAWTAASVLPGDQWCRWEERRLVRTSPPSPRSPPGPTSPVWAKRENPRPSGLFLTTWPSWGELTCNSKLW